MQRRQELARSSMQAGAGAGTGLLPGQRGTCEPLLMNLKQLPSHCALQGVQQDLMVALLTRTAPNLWGVMHLPWPSDWVQSAASALCCVCKVFSCKSPMTLDSPATPTDLCHRTRPYSLFLYIAQAGHWLRFDLGLQVQHFWHQAQAGQVGRLPPCCDRRLLHSWLSLQRMQKTCRPAAF